MLHFARRLMLAALLLGTGLVSCTDDPAGPAGATGLSGIIDISESDSRDEIMTIDLASGATGSTLAGHSPFRTAEGTVVLVRSNGDLVETNGTQERVIVEQDSRIPNTESYDDAPRNPRVSPDGRLVAYEGTYTYYGVHIVDRATGELLYSIEPTESGEGYLRPSWVSNTELVVAGYQRNPGLHLVDLEALTMTRIDDDLASPSEPVVSPDGSRVAFILNGHVWIMKLDGTGLRQLSTSTASESLPTWSPDGRWILTKSVAELYAVQVDGTAVVDIMETYRGGRAYLGSTQTSWR